MKVEELRINNWVSYKGIDVQFHIADFDEANNNRYQFMELFVKPIPLTDEWLKKLGFWTKNEKVGWYKRVGFQYTSRLTTSGYFNVQMIMNGFYFGIADCKYVHQLQNLYFALTGEELTYEI